MTPAARRTSALLAAGAVAAAAVGIGGIAYAATRTRGASSTIGGAAFGGVPVEPPSSTERELVIDSIQAIRQRAANPPPPTRTGDRPSSAPRTGQREASFVDCAVTIDGVTARRRVTAEECAQLRAGVQVVTDAERGGLDLAGPCNRTPARLCKEDPAFCARNSASLAGAAIATAGSGGFGWPSLLVPVASWVGKLRALPCESEGEES